MPAKVLGILNAPAGKTLESGDLGRGLRVEYKKVEKAKIPTHVVSWAHLGPNG